MDFATYLNQAWTDHATQPQQVMDGFATGASLISAAEHIPQLAALVTHVMGEHLGQWESGEILLNSLKSNGYYAAGGDSEKAILRSIACLRLANGDSEMLNTYGVSDQIRILAVAASALSGKDVERAQELFNQALSRSERGLERNDPAARALAVTGNNLACSLEELSPRSPAQTKLMIAAAHTARKFWELAGTWTQVKDSEYRLAFTYMAAQDPEKAFEHAKNCLDLTLANEVSALESFFAYEAMALTERARGNFPGFTVAVEKAKGFFAELSDDDKKWCEGSIKKLALN